MQHQERGGGGIGRAGGSREKRVSRVFAALSDPVRRTILEELGAGPRGATKLGERFGISQPAISRHVRVLREAGLIRTHVQGRNHWCVLHGPGMKDAAAWVERYRAFWEGQLDALEAFVLESAAGDAKASGNAGGKSGVGTRSRRGTQRGARRISQKGPKR